MQPLTTDAPDAGETVALADDAATVRYCECCGYTESAPARARRLCCGAPMLLVRGCVVLDEPATLRERLALHPPTFSRARVCAREGSSRRVFSAADVDAMREANASLATDARAAVLYPPFEYVPPSYWTFGGRVS